jgi:hypothetical protein
MSIGSIGKKASNWSVKAVEQLNNLRVGDNLARICTIIGCALRILSKQDGHVKLPNLYSYAENFPNVTYAMDAFRIAYNWWRPISSETVENKEDVIEQLNGVIGQLPQHFSHLNIPKNFSKEVLKVVFASGKAYHSQKAVREAVEKTIIRQLSLIPDNKTIENLETSLKAHLTGLLKDFKVNSPSILERLACLSYTVATVSWVITLGHQWRLYNLSSIASKLGATKVFKSPVLILGTILIGSLLAANIFKFLDTQRKQIVLKYQEERIQSCFDSFLAIANMILYSASLIRSLSTRTIDYITISVKSLEIVGGAVRPYLVPVPF